MTLMHLVREIQGYEPSSVRNTEYDENTLMPIENYRHAMSLLREHSDEYNLVPLAVEASLNGVAEMAS